MEVGVALSFTPVMILIKRLVREETAGDPF